MIDWIIAQYTASAVVKFFFWGPVVFNGLSYPVLVWKKVQENKKSVANNGSTYDFVTVGDLFKYFFMTVLPVMNALAMIFDCGPEIFQILTKRFAWLFSITLVKIPEKK